MIQSEIVNELMKIYDQAACCYEYKHGSSFYKCLKNQILLSANKYTDSESVLYSYQIACKSYLNSNLLDFNIWIVSVLIALVGLGKIMENAGSISIMGMFILTGYLGFGSIVSHRKKRKVIEIFNVLEGIDSKGTE